MNYGEILSELKKYYPFGIPFMSPDYLSSKEFQNNRKVLKEQYEQESANLINTKQELGRLLDSEIYIFAFAAGHFCLHYTFFIQGNPDKYYSILVSTIIPFYTIRILDINTWEIDFSSFQKKFPLKAEIISKYIEEHFSGYQIITDNELLNRPIDGVEVDESDHPNLLNLAFTSILT